MAFVDPRDDGLATADSGPAGLGTTREPGTYTSVCTIPGNLLNEGHYYLSGVMGCVAAADKWRWFCCTAA